MELNSSQKMEHKCLRGKKKCSTSLAIRSMKIATTLRFHFTQTRMAKITKKTKTTTTTTKQTNKNQITTYNHKDVKGDRTLIHCLWEFKLVYPVGQYVWTFTQKLKTHLPQDPDVTFCSRHPMDSML